MQSVSNHLQPVGHWEGPETKRRMHNLLAVSGLLGRLAHIAPRAATEAELARCAFSFPCLLAGRCPLAACRSPSAKTAAANAKTKTQKPKPRLSLPNSRRPHHHHHQKQNRSVHSPDYIRRVQALSADNTKGHHTVGDVATFAPGGYEIAALAAGGAIAAVDAVLAGEVVNAYALVRPPGHHAERDHGMGARGAALGSPPRRPPPPPADRAATGRSPAAPLPHGPFPGPP